jgi:Mn-containing catalase
MADFRSNLSAESQGLLQAVRMYEMTEDPGVKDTLSFMIARDTMHQNQWLAAIEDLQSEGFEETVVPKVAREYEKKEFSYQFWNHSEGEESAQGRWAKGPSIDGRGEFEYVANPQPLGPEPTPPQPDPRLYSTPMDKSMQKTTGDASNPIQGAADAIGGAAETIKRTIIGE